MRSFHNKKVTNKEVKLTKKERRKLKVENNKKAYREGKIELKERKQRKLERWKDEVIEFEKCVKIDNRNKVKTKVERLSSFMIEN